jgi:hypothetical protein
VAGTELPDKPATWRCTNCGATAFRKYSIVYDEQRSSARFHVSGGGIAVSSEGPGVAVGSASGRSVQETKLSSRVAPPVAPPRPYGGPGCSAMLLAVVIPPSLFGRKNWQPRRTRALPDEEVRYRARLDRWNRSYLCVNCGATRLLPETKQQFAARYPALAGAGFGLNCSWGRSFHSAGARRLPLPEPIRTVARQRAKTAARAPNNRSRAVAP